MSKLIEKEVEKSFKIIITGGFSKLFKIETIVWTPALATFMDFLLD